jgi:hypothetical protein
MDPTMRAVVFIPQALGDGAYVVIPQAKNKQKKHRSGASGFQSGLCYSAERYALRCSCSATSLGFGKKERPESNPRGQLQFVICPNACVAAFTDLDVILLTHPIRVNPTMRAVVFIPQALGDETRLFFLRQWRGDEARSFFPLRR